RAAKEASLPTFRISYEASGQVATFNGKALHDGQEQSFDNLAQLLLPGIGNLTLRSNRPADSDTMLIRKETERRKLLEAAALPDLAEARRKQASSQAKMSKREQVRLRLEHLAPDGLARLREEVAKRDCLR